MNKFELETMIAAYVECALWSSTDDNDKTLDDKYGESDVLKETMREMRADCKAFGQDNATDIGSNWERAGHEFWLTRNRHGAGFWDGDWPEPAGKRLTDAAHAFGSVDLYVYRGKVRK